MVLPPKSPPRFVPTLTEVVHVEDLQISKALPASVPSTAHLPAHLDAVTEGIEELVVHRVMQRVDLVLDQRMREAIALVIQEQTRSLLPRLREEIESVVRHAVYEAVAEELTVGNLVNTHR